MCNPHQVNISVPQFYHPEMGRIIVFTLIEVAQEENIIVCKDLKAVI